MSYVHNYVLLTSLSEEIKKDRSGVSSYPSIDALNALIGSQQQGRGFIDVHDQAGGYKAFEALCFLFAGNYLPLIDMARSIAAVQWEDSETVQLLHRDQEYQQKFSIYDLCELTEIARKGVQGSGS